MLEGSFPTWERELKFMPDVGNIMLEGSFPTWERELKFGLQVGVDNAPNGRSPRGNVN